MMMTLLRRELLDNLMTFRFATAMFITLLLVVVNTAVLLKDYERRLASYNAAATTQQRTLDETKTYSAAAISIARPPNPLSIFNVGFDKRLGNQSHVSYRFVPSLWDAGKHGTDNPFMDMFAAIDIVFILQVILSLLALIFAYDALAGEYEAGTLRLVLTHPIGRGYILLAKYVSAMICLLVPLLISLLLAVILLTTSPSISLNTADFLRIGGLIFTSAVYLSVFYLIGLLISAATRRTSTALMLSMFVWGFLVLVYPNVILAIVPQHEAPKERRTAAYNQVEQLWEELDRERKHFLATDEYPGEDWGLDLRGWGSRYDYAWGDLDTLIYTYEIFMDFTGFNEADERKMPHAQKHFRYLGPRIIGAADRTWLIRKPALEEIYIQPAQVEHTWLKLSPVGLYDTATQAWIGTDLHGVRDFFDATRRYRQQLIDYLYAKDAFGSRQWFASDRGPADWSGLPQFSFQRAEVHTNVKRAFPDLFLLLMMNIGLFIVILLIFLKTEV